MSVCDSDCFVDYCREDSAIRCRAKSAENSNFKPSYEVATEKPNLSVLMFAHETFINIKSCRLRFGMAEKNQLATALSSNSNASH